MYLRLGSFLVIYIGIIFGVKAQTYSFTSNCKPAAGDSVILNAFANSCIRGWKAETGHAFLISSAVNSAVLRSEESILLNKQFSRCSIYNFTFKLKLKEASDSRIELLFRDKLGNVFIQPYKLKAGYAHGWTTILIHSLQLPADYESLSVSFKGQANTIFINEITIASECGQNQAFANANLSGKLQNEGILNVSNSQVLTGDSLLLTSDQQIILKEDVVLTSGSEVIIKVNPCSKSDEKCGPEQPKEFAVFNFLSPNGDGQNDTFYIDGLEQFPDAEVSIINKSGKQVFHTSQYNNDWNGGAQPGGIYTYQIRLESGKKPLTGELLLTK